MEGESGRIIKITNFPDVCTVSIYSLNGKLIRQLEKNGSNPTYMEWDMRNTAGKLITGGMYIIHIDAPGIGERTLKWYCSMVPLDVNDF
ncbi:MAG: hypothetical protein C0592_10860 [Marinilabiliales bacterium]|nr:MAG: hypothetical protein C0592_10860 [Marinilabiliales bacterium]